MAGKRWETLNWKCCRSADACSATVSDGDVGPDRAKPTDRRGAAPASAASCLTFRTIGIGSAVPAFAAYSTMLNFGEGAAERAREPEVARLATSPRFRRSHIASGAQAAH